MHAHAHTHTHTLSVPKAAAGDLAVHLLATADVPQHHRVIKGPRDDLRP